jgi:DeoR/GlpR family transcriptional regulator of sugar metabolism
MITKLTILRDLYYLDDEEETERRHGLERPSRDDDYQDSEEEEDEDKNEEYETEDNEAGSEPDRI